MIPQQIQFAHFLLYQRFRYLVQIARIFQHRAKYNKKKIGDRSANLFFSLGMKTPINILSTPINILNMNPLIGTFSFTKFRSFLFHVFCSNETDRKITNEERRNTIKLYINSYKK